ncbi:hypothetical protein PCI56_06540 [Plesiomonas shigelloides subsp. oncorhynchi]|nr:hypothetical protein [Plesiomonas shigelloides]
MSLKSENSWLFLRRAIKELVSHDDSKDDGLTEETATISTTFIQIAFELSLVAHFIKKMESMELSQVQTLH